MPEAGLEPALPGGKGILSPAPNNHKGSHGKSLGNKQVRCAAPALARSTDSSPNLARLVELWDSLSDTVKGDIIALAESSADLPEL